MPILGIFDYIKIGIVAILIVVVGYLVWNYQHLKGVVAAQKTEIASLKEVQGVLTSKADKVDKFMAQMNQAKRKVANVEDKVDKVPSVPDSVGDALVLDLLKPYRMRDDKIQNPAVGGKGDAKPAPRPKADPRLN